MSLQLYFVCFTSSQTFPIWWRFMYHAHLCRRAFIAIGWVAQSFLVVVQLFICPHGTISFFFFLFFLLYLLLWTSPSPPSPLSLLSSTGTKVETLYIWRKLTKIWSSFLLLDKKTRKSNSRETKACPCALCPMKLPRADKSNPWNAGSKQVSRRVDGAPGLVVVVQRGSTLFALFSKTFIAGASLSLRYVCTKHRVVFFCVYLFFVFVFWSLSSLFLRTLSWLLKLYSVYN